MHSHQKSSLFNISEASGTIEMGSSVLSVLADE
jgi:hypothetical protein